MSDSNFTSLPDKFIEKIALDHRKPALIYRQPRPRNGHNLAITIGQIIIFQYLSVIAISVRLARSRLRVLTICDIWSSRTAFIPDDRIISAAFNAPLKLI